LKISGKILGSPGKIRSSVNLPEDRIFRKIHWSFSDPGASVGLPFLDLPEDPRTS